MVVGVRKFLPVAVAAPRGVVGEELVRRLSKHPWFEVVATPTVDDVSAGDAKLVFSALPPSAAPIQDAAWLSEGRWVFANSGGYPLGSVPVFVPEINPECFPSSEEPVRIASPNCAAHGLCLALAPMQSLGLKRVLVSTLQATSGAGRNGVPELAAGDNLLPWIPEEEERLQCDAASLLEPALDISATCHRVPVADGHVLSVSVELGKSVQESDLRQAFLALHPTQLPTCPGVPLCLHDDPDRPQAAFDLDAGAGMQISLGRLRRCPVLGWKFTILIANRIRGGAGAMLLNAEFLARRFGWVDSAV